MPFPLSLARFLSHASTMYRIAIAQNTPDALAGAAELPAFALQSGELLPYCSTIALLGIVNTMSIFELTG